MSLGYYNRTGYNIGAVDAQKNQAAYAMFATLSASFAIGAIFSPSYFCSTSLQAQLDAGWGYSIPYAFTEDLDADMTADSLATPSYAMEAAIDFGANLSAAWIVSYTMNTDFESSMLMRYVVYPVYRATAELESVMKAYVALFLRYAEMYQPLSALFTMIPIRTTSMLLDVVIPPGGRLVIDSDHYTIYLNNQNAIHAYSGDWIKLSRPFLALEVESGTSGALDVGILYREAYL